MRCVVFGHSGSGKSTLARSLARDGAAHLDLDALAWRPTDPPTRVPLDEAGGAIHAFIEAHSSWVIEGCYADLIARALPHATRLVFLDLPVATCQAHARQRPWEPHKYPTPEEQDANLPMLLDWIAAYPAREGPLGRAAHAALYEAFEGEKERRVGR
jgi:adenylate kinase family enzyme